jgi:tRNA (guanine37-N1)-methyltransferase
VIEAVARLAPGVLGSADSAGDDSHAGGWLEYPQYTRPPEFEGLEVPETLLSGNHEQIRRWRRKESLRRTFLRRPDLAARAPLAAGDYALLEELAAEEESIRPLRERWAALAPPPKRARRRKDGA